MQEDELHGINEMLHDEAISAERYNSGIIFRKGDLPWVRISRANLTHMLSQFIARSEVV